MGVRPVSGLRLADRGEKGIRLDAYAGRNAGVRGGIKATRTALQWMIAEQALGRGLGDGEGTVAAVQEYAEWWRVGERTAWHHLEYFRAGFPGEDTPARLAGLLAARAEVRRSGAKGLGRVQLVAPHRHVAQ